MAKIKQIKSRPFLAHDHVSRRAMRIPVLEGRCGACRFGRVLWPDAHPISASPLSCRRRAPTVEGCDDHGRWPLVWASDGCGEWAPRGRE